MKNAQRRGWITERHQSITLNTIDENTNDQKSSELHDSMEALTDNLSLWKYKNIETSDLNDSRIEYLKSFISGELDRAVIIDDQNTAEIKLVYKVYDDNTIYVKIFKTKHEVFERLAQPGPGKACTL